jgi:flagellar hook assembly protein FlgD
VSDGSTTAQRVFSVNNTLAGVAVSGTDVSFELARAAAVTVTVQKANGVTVATPLAKRLAPGAQRVRWNGTPRSGYRVQVTAANTIGTVAQTVPLGSRRRS